MNYEVLIAVIIGMPEEEIIGYYDEEECQCCYDTGIWRKGMDESGSSKFSR